jgi:hypothetical protein
MDTSSAGGLGRVLDLPYVSLAAAQAG